MGARAGVSLVEFESGVISAEFSEALLSAALLEEVAEKSSGALEVTSIKSCGGSSLGVELYSIKSPQKQAAAVKVDPSCGASGACSVSLVLSPTDNGLQRLMAAEPSC